MMCSHRCWEDLISRRVQRSSKFSCVCSVATERVAEGRRCRPDAVLDLLTRCHQQRTETLIRFRWRRCQLWSCCEITHQNARRHASHLVDGDDNGQDNEDCRQMMHSTRKMTVEVQHHHVCVCVCVLVGVITRRLCEDLSLALVYIVTVLDRIKQI